MVGKIFPLIDNCLQTNPQEAQQQLKDTMLRTQEAQQHLEKLKRFDIEGAYVAASAQLIQYILKGFTVIKLIGT